MVIDFDGLTIIVFLIIFVVTSLLIKVITKKPNIYFVFLFIMFIYITNVARLTIFPLYINCNFESNLYQNINIVPFRHFILRDAIMNFILTIPLGIGLPFVILQKFNIKIIGIIGFGFGILIESMQYIGGLISDNFTIRYIDINDVIFNFFGVVSGYIVLRVFTHLYLKVDRLKLKCFGKYVYNVCSKNNWNSKK